MENYHLRLSRITLGSVNRQLNLTRTHVFVVVDGALVDMEVHISLQHTYFTYFGYLPRSGKAGSYRVSVCSV